MEDMARLALVEQDIGNIEKFRTLLSELLSVISNILENRHDYELRTLKSDTLNTYLDIKAFSDYLKYVGFQKVGNQWMYPKEETLSKLRMAHAAVIRKIRFCYGSLKQPAIIGPKIKTSKTELKPEIVLTTKNSFLRKIESLFNNVLKYEDEKLQQKALQQIPLVTLQLRAIDRLREHQMKIKTGETKAHDMPYDIALLMEVLGWFKHKYFMWVDKPPCKKCGGITKFAGNTTKRVSDETCTVELYACTVCSAGYTSFPRLNSPAALLLTRRGRCGEWANCFALFCRALGYDTRYVYDTTDHVWCEVYDYDSKTWLHVDPCECKLNAPLLYSAGWGKKLSYVIAVACDDIQDVTWRYTTQHREVLKRRNLVLEHELVDAILKLRGRRQRQLSEPRRRYLTRRTLEELVQLMQERQASDYENHGRISGAKEWRSQRGESGTLAGHEFTFTNPGAVRIRYFCAEDEYRVTGMGVLKSWMAGVYAIQNVFRNVEADWMKVYLAREAGCDFGRVCWRIRCESPLVFTSLCVKATHARFSTGCVRWALRFDDQEPQHADIGEKPIHFKHPFHTAEIFAEMSGGSGDVAWQHAQLFRQDSNPGRSPAPAFEVHLNIVPETHRS